VVNWSNSLFDSTYAFIFDCASIYFFSIIEVFVMHVYYYYMQNNTPKKNASVNGINGTTFPDVARKIDLRLEAKLSAEVSLRFIGFLVNTSIYEILPH
jgi:hypothetical protein